MRGRIIPVLVVLAIALVARAGADNPSVDTGAPTYRIGPGDMLRVIVWGETGLDLSLRVRPDGFVSFPMVDDVRATGLTPSQLGAVLERKLSAFLRHPDVTVIVEEINSIRIHVLGEVNAQGSYRFDHRPTLLEALAMAGGPTPVARGRVLVIRHGPVGHKRFELDLNRILSARKSSALDPRLEPGDIIVVR